MTLARRRGTVDALHGSLVSSSRVRALARSSPKVGLNPGPDLCPASLIQVQLLRLQHYSIHLRSRPTYKVENDVKFAY